MTNPIRPLAVACSLAIASFAALAQAPAQPPKPGPEHQKLGYFVGKWTTEGETKPNPFMPGGKMTSRDTCEWFEGGFSVVCRSEGTSPTGPTKSLGIMGYNMEEKAYTYFGIDNTPMAMGSVPMGTLQGDTWTYLNEDKMNGKPVKSRFTIKQASPKSYTFKWEMFGEDGSWQTLMEGTSTKAS